jgi:hypothetical protein
MMAQVGKLTVLVPDHKTYYGRNLRLECLSLNTRLGWKGLPGKTL